MTAAHCLPPQKNSFKQEAFPMNIAIVTGASSGMGREFVLQLPRYVDVEEIWQNQQKKPKNNQGLTTK